jgi:exosome complex component RRP42
MKKKMEEMISKGLRFDERGLLDHRKLEISYNVSHNAEGSARVKLGDTEVIAGVKMDLVEPFKDSPDSGVLSVGAELLPLASERFEMGAPDIQAIEMARLVDRGVRNSECIDMKKLCVKEGEKVWSVMVDFYIMNDAGGLIDASFIAAVAALHNAKMPEVKDDKVQYGELSSKSLPMTCMPTTVTVYKINGKFLLDPTVEEEDATTARLTFTITFPEEEIHSMQKTGEELTEDEILAMMDIALKEGKKLNVKINALLKK